MDAVSFCASCRLSDPPAGECRAATDPLVSLGRQPKRMVLGRLHPDAHFLLQQCLDAAMRNRKPVLPDEQLLWQ